MQASQYYDRLGVITVEAWQNQIAFLSLAGSSASPEDQDIFQKRVDALSRRSSMARALANAYVSIGSLRSSDGLNSVSTAGKNLGAAIGGIPNLPGASAAATAPIGQAAQFLAGLKRGSDAHKALESLSQAGAYQNDLFVHERTAYIAMEVDRDETADRLLRQLAGAKLVNPSALLRFLHLGVPQEAFPDNERIRAMALSASSVALYRKKTAWACATENTAGTLEITATQTKDLATPNSSALNQLDQELAQAKTCMSEYQILDVDK